MKNSIILCSIVLPLCCLPVFADIHKCTDENGAMQFSDTPCGSNMKTLKPLKSGAGMDDARRNEKRDKLLHAYEDERREKQQRKSDAETKRARQQENCAIARNTLLQITQASSLYDLDEKGNRANLTDKERAQATEQVRADVAYWCD